MAGGLLLALVGLLGLQNLSPASDQLEPQQERHPNVRDAMRDLRSAWTNLEKAPDIFGGHRAEAIRLAKDAHEECQKAIDFASKRSALGDEVGSEDKNRLQKSERHPRIRESMRDLRSSWVSLEKAPAIYGGHRDKAVKLAKQAHEECEKAIAFADKK
jgi:hypothetical protein